ncbi:PQQ-dependent sugar dehydrogenase [Thioalkalivibrio sp. XN8]|uniref:PQQ-dependent sugar dehydrogenase n=1 Tax=Thioalkalivibrio sp. XN8 TaxID=2712863 RepID=UPI001F0CE8A0|nr:PQQ-dependent sugar dehydrogenase [Thioalkalivibrio sp. XN8]
MVAVLGAAAGPAFGAAPEIVVDEMRTQYQKIRVVKLAGGLERPWAVAFLPDGGYLVTERPGRLQLVRDGARTEIGGLPEITAIRQGGLLDVSLHPEFERSPWVYLSYAKGGEGGTALALGRGRLEGDRLAGFEEIFVQDRFSVPGRHYGSRIAWLPDGTLLLSIGDRGAEPARAQDLGDHAGKLLRLNADGSVPADNPFVGREGAQPEIWSLGHRNIQGLVVGPGADVIWATEHGPRGGDELNRIEPALNYGWPIVSRARQYGDESPYGEARRREGFEDPVYEFLPTLAPSGLALVTTDRFPAWRGNLLAGGLVAERIRRVVLEDGEVVHEEELLLGVVGRIRDVREGPEGLIYVLSDTADGGLYRIEPVD